MTNAGREQAGAGFYGVLELSGNLWERSVSVGYAQGRTFRGTHGDGVLSTNGWATNSDWPGYSSGEVTSAVGAGMRGGAWSSTSDWIRISDRYYGIGVGTNRVSAYGWRAVRTAPVSAVSTAQVPTAVFSGGSYDGYDSVSGQPVLQDFVSIFLWRGF